MLRNTLNNKEKKFLRSLGMKLDAIVFIGKEGVTPNVVNAAIEAIERNELIKVKIQQNCLETVDNALVTLAERVDADLVQIIGRNGLIWKRNFQKPRITFPK